jgi:hypothetical protein
MAELDSEERWSTSFASSQDELAALTEAALVEIAAGEVGAYVGTLRSRHARWRGRMEEVTDYSSVIFRFRNL